VAQLPTASTTSPTFGDYVFSIMPNVAPVGTFVDNQDPHALTVFNLPNICKDCAVISNISKTALAVIDLNQLMAASRAGTEGHTVSSSVSLTTPFGGGNAIVTYITTGLSKSSVDRAPASTRSNNNIR
jgi:hypothetical protein